MKLCDKKGCEKQADDTYEVGIFDSGGNHLYGRAIDACPEHRGEIIRGIKALLTGVKP